MWLCRRSEPCGIEMLSAGLVRDRKKTSDLPSQQISSLKRKKVFFIAMNDVYQQAMIRRHRHQGRQQLSRSFFMLLIAVKHKVHRIAYPLEAFYVYCGTDYRRK